MIDDPVDDRSAEPTRTMPFLPVASKDGPYEDDAYEAGWEMGTLDMVLGCQRPAIHELFILTGNAEQAELIAMRHGYQLACGVPRDDGRIWLSFSLNMTATL